jgi:L-asparaginase II
MANPVLAEVTRGTTVESRHTGSYCVVDSRGKVVAAVGDSAAAVFPRSAIKAFQCLPLIESGAADRFGFTGEDIALACSSHNGEPEHVRVARSMLARADVAETCYECGAHWPSFVPAQLDVARQGGKALAVHNNCSGKHAGMLALARHLGAPTTGYVGIGHPVQVAVAKAIGRMCDVDMAQLPWGIDGCSVPTWAFPLRNMALGFAHLCQAEYAAGQRIITAAAAHPFMVAGTDRFDTRLMTEVPRAFVKVGAEGVFCGSVAHAGLGIALKIDDGSGRAAEVAMAAVLACLPVWTEDEQARLAGFRQHRLENWNRIHVGDVRASL